MHAKRACKIFFSVLARPLTRASYFANLMSKNPLTLTIVVFILGDGYTIWEAIQTRTVLVFTAISWLQGLILLILYIKRSPFAGAYLFYSILPFFPIYYGLKLAGITPPPKTNVVYFVAFAIYVLGLPVCWRLRRNYDRYIASVKSVA
jgi:hypothetical protein